MVFALNQRNWTGIGLKTSIFLILAPQFLKKPEAIFEYETFSGPRKRGLYPTDEKGKYNLYR